MTNITVVKKYQTGFFQLNLDKFYRTTESNEDSCTSSNELNMLKQKKKTTQKFIN